MKKGQLIKYILVFFAAVFFIFSSVPINALNNSVNDTNQIDDEDITFDLNETVLNNSKVDEVLSEEEVSADNVSEAAPEVSELQNDVSKIKEQIISSYIIEFEKEPLLQKFKDKDLLKKDSKSKNKVLGSFINPLAIKSNDEIILNDYHNELKLEHILAISDIEKTLNEDNSSSILDNFLVTVGKVIYRITGFNVLSNGLKPSLEFYKVFNGIVIEMGESDAELILQSQYVKGVYLDEEVNITLLDSVPLIGADEVWKLDDRGGNCDLTGGECLTGKGVTIAVIDTGVDYTHADLGGCYGAGCKVIGGYDFINKDSDPMDDHGHGTHVAATAAGDGFANNISIKGAAPDANILAYKVLSRYGSGSFSAVIAGVERAVDPNQDGDFSDAAEIISMSLGGYGNPDDSLSRAVDNAVNAGVVSVIAAGNSGPNPNTIRTPGTSRKAITIGATDKLDRLAYFSSRGPVIWSGGTINKPDITAPGVSICAAEWDSAWSYARCLDTKHTSISGTSMATPHVSGAVALLLQKDPNLTPDEIKDILKQTAVVLPKYTINDVGSGRIDILTAVNSLSSNCNDGSVRQCGTNVGECRFGNQTCDKGKWKKCEGSVDPSNELCDGLDNNCNSKIDDDLAAKKCNLQKGVCAGSTEVCAGFSGWVACNNSNYGPNYEIIEKKCDDGYDNDCDGNTDSQDKDCICELTSAHWSKTKILQNEVVTLNVYGNNCDSSDIVEFKVRLTTNSSYIVGYPKESKFSDGNKSSTNWAVEYKRDFNGIVNYYFTASLLPNLSSNLSSKDFVNGTLIVEPLPDEDGDGVEDGFDKCPRTPLYLKDYVNKYGCPKPKSSKFNIKPDFDNEDIRNITRFEIGDRDYGKINYYNKNFSLMDKKGSFFERLDLDSNIKISRHKIELNSSALPVLNESANLTMYNITLMNPVILKDGEICSYCFVSYWNKNNGTMEFSVPHFTVYELVEGQEDSPGESPGGSPGGGSGGGGGGGGGGSSKSSTQSAETAVIEECVERWVCDEWSVCSNGIKTRQCTDENRCSNKIYKPALRQSCGDQSSLGEINELSESFSDNGAFFENEPIKDNFARWFTIGLGFVVIFLLIIGRIIMNKKKFSKTIKKR